MSYELLEQEVGVVKGVGKERALELTEMGINTLRDLFNYYPYRYEDYQVRDLDAIIHGDKATIEGVIFSEPLIKTLAKNKNYLSVRVAVDNYLITAVWFNRAFLKRQLRIGRPVLLTGKWDKNRLQLTVYESEFLDSQQPSKKGHLLPVYSLPGNISQNVFRKILISAFKQFYHALTDYYPTEVLDKYKMYSLTEALKAIHFPKDYQDGKHARRRLVYDELLFYQLKIHYYKLHNRNNWVGTAKEIDHQRITDFINKLPFSLTKAQNRVIAEILADMSNEQAMNRLLQGDVGSGKTVVAAVTLYANYLSGNQGALMVPTEILAEQHYSSMINYLANYDIEVALLTGKLTAANRRSILGQLQMGFIDVVVGTHAIIQDEVFFKNLGFVITDEQHRFGVEQRAALRKKGQEKTPDVLYMTATPIPRTLAITAYGDMEISTIDEYPVGRKKIETYWVKPKAFARVLDFMEKELKAGRQAYVICPLIEESEKLDLQNALEVHGRLTEHFSNYSIGLLHGRQTAKEKDEIMSRFTGNHLNVLVSTTVVEVGVDVPNATLMVIYDAERFGLAQLHQLRGRVGRGEWQSYCVLLADPKNEISKERMRVMTETNDGFVIARKDLELRGQGDFFGSKQSGLPVFKLADLFADYRTLEVASADAGRLIKGSEFWQDPKWSRLVNELQRFAVFQNETLDS